MKNISWQGNSPKSNHFDDIYFSSDDGMIETKAVFLDGIHAPDIWLDKDDFYICELGFGTGLNFLSTVKLWMETANPQQKLTYYATEKFLLTNEEIRKAIHWPELKIIRDKLLNQYPSDVIKFDNVKLKILNGDSLDQLKYLNGKIDAWFLDGFAPSKNPDMWTADIYQEVARCSNLGAMVSTFTAAGHVRRGLYDVGFDMVKRPGYGKKREMLHGCYKGA